LRRILITNDDGFDSPGLKALVEAVKDLAQVMVVAPAAEKSACAHSLTLSKPMRFIKLDDDFYKLDDGTPTDCIYLALNSLFEEGLKPDLVISGINKGANMGEDITYSGTAAGAMEGTIHGIPSIAISQVCKDRCQEIDRFDFALAKKTIRELVQKIFAEEFPLEERRFLNVNIPPIGVEESKGVKITKAGYRLYGNDAHLHRNPRGEEYYWLGLHPLAWNEEKRPESDFDAVFNNYVSITPIKLDMSAYESMEQLKSWI